MLATRLENLPLNRCRVAKSNIAGAGNGVFACRDIVQGELVTLYPGDAVKIQDDDDSSTQNGGDDGEAAELLWAVEAADGSRRRPDASMLERAKDYEREVASGSALSVLGDPARAEDPAYLGHMINDGVTCDRNALRATYLTEAAIVCNVHHFAPGGACHVAVVATRDIAAGEELFMSYGSNYWLSRLASHAGASYEGRLLEDYWIEGDADEEYARHRTRSRRRSGAGGASSSSSRRRSKRGRDRYGAYD